MSSLLQQILNQVDQLTPEEQMQVIGHLMTQIQTRAVVTSKPSRSWQDLEGIAPNLLGGEDAQAWVNRQRDEWDDREQSLRAE
ncbi:MAG TPA: hypothetical protein V6C78_05610 [Crinalium sp.]|jgi:hypothetical protein